MCALAGPPNEIIAMTTHTHQTAPTQYVEANGIRFAYRRFGKAGGVPPIINKHFTGNHGAQYQYPERFVRQVACCLDE
jgi:hypothetical protein